MRVGPPVAGRLDFPQEIGDYRRALDDYRVLTGTHVLGDGFGLAGDMRACEDAVVVERAAVVTDLLGEIEATGNGRADAHLARARGARYAGGVSEAEAAEATDIVEELVAERSRLPNVFGRTL